MQFAADLHIHSPYSRATSPELALPNLWAVAQRKGLQLVGTGDCVHPVWLREMEENLEESGDGFLRLRKEKEPAAGSVPGPCRADVRFVPTVEISSIYKRGGAVRKVHNVIVLPGIPAARTLQARLAALGNIQSDGRPILGLDSRDLLEIVLETDPAAFLIPAHIWTPWFSALGSRSGFDSIAECYADLISHIRAVETGLSSDPPMNRRLSSLDPFVLVSSSDAHSPDKLGREATLFDTAFTYDSMRRALTDPADKGLAGTIEFFPEEGKYHYDGHRACGVRLTPQETRARAGRCPRCGKPLTVGVMARVEDLADRAAPAGCPSARPHVSCVPLAEVVGEALETGESSKAVRAVCDDLRSSVGPELTVLRSAPLEDINRVAGPLVAEGICRMRLGEVTVVAGYDGEFGTVSVLSPEVRERLSAQVSLFAAQGRGRAGAGRKRRSAGAGGAAAVAAPGRPAPVFVQGPPPAPLLNDAQQRAVAFDGGHLLIVAGPGTGKTHTLVHRIARVAAALPAGRSVLAVTFTNRAAREMRERLERLVPKAAARVTVGTFHRVCLQWLREFREAAGLPDGFSVASEAERAATAARLWPKRSRSARAQALEAISSWKSAPEQADPPPGAAEYDQALHDSALLDFDDLLRETLRLLRGKPDIAAILRNRHAAVCVDEFQDIDPVQTALLATLAAGAPVTAIGDPDQSIYGFRGATGSGAERLSAVLPGATAMYLTENYRSAAPLLTASSQVIAPQRSAGTPLLVPAVALEGTLVIREAPTERAEAEYVVHQIERLVGGTTMFSRDSGRVDAGDSGRRSFGDIAVLYRLNALQPPLREALDRSGIPYQVSGETPLAGHAMAADLLTCLRLADGRAVEAEAAAGVLRRVIPGFGEQRASMYVEQGEQRRSLADISDGMAPRFHPALHDICANLRQLGGTIERGLPGALAAAAQLGWWQKERAEPRGQALWQQLEQAAGAATGLDDFCDTLLTGRAEDLHDSRAERVALMTLHAAKGLEFPVVFVVGCEEHLLPLDLEGRRGDLAEERRLLYVAVSRAGERLYLVRTRCRRLHGMRHENKPSRFLADIEEQLKHYDTAGAGRKKGHGRGLGRPSAQLDLFAGGR